MPTDRLFSDDPSQFFGGPSPHRHSEKQGMEGSVRDFFPSRVVQGQSPDQKNRRTVMIETPLQLTWTVRKRKCYDCQRGTHLQWTRDSYTFRLCQASARRRGGIYLDTLKMF